jgi:hypothetical protein
MKSGYTTTISCKIRQQLKECIIKSCCWCKKWNETHSVWRHGMVWCLGACILSQDGNFGNLIQFILIKVHWKVIPYSLLWNTSTSFGNSVELACDLEDTASSKWPLQHILEVWTNIADSIINITNWAIKGAWSSLTLSLIQRVLRSAPQLDMCAVFSAHRHLYLWQICNFWGIWRIPAPMSFGTNVNL